MKPCTRRVYRSCAQQSKYVLLLSSSSVFRYSEAGEPTRERDRSNRTRDTVDSIIILSKISSLV